MENCKISGKCYYLRIVDEIFGHTDLSFYCTLMAAPKGHGKQTNKYLVWKIERNAAKLIYDYHSHTRCLLNALSTPKTIPNLLEGHPRKDIPTLLCL